MEAPTFPLKWRMIYTGDLCMHLLYNLSVKMFNNEDLNRNSNIQKISDFDLKLQEGNCNEIATYSNPNIQIFIKMTVPLPSVPQGVGVLVWQ